MSTLYAARTDWRSLALVALLHAALLGALLESEPVVEAVTLPQVLSVSLLQAEQAEPPAAKPAPAPKRVPPQMPAQVRSPPQQIASPLALPQSASLSPAPPPTAPEAVAPVPAVAPQPSAPSVAASLPVSAPLAAPPAHSAPVSPPRFDADYLDNPSPVYPALSRRLGEHGQVLLRVLVSLDGLATQVEIRETSGYERLDRAARDTVRRWRFAPARQGEASVAAWVLVPLSFSLRS